MNLLIIEDEQEAAERLRRMLLEIDLNIKVTGQTESISSTKKWLKENPLPDAILSDIQLADGDSFEIFKTEELKIPIIFTTAFNQYALEAFKLFSVDYLLKPIKKKELENSLKKLKQLYIQPNQPPGIDYQKLSEVLVNKTELLKPKRILTKVGQNLKAIDLDDIFYFHTENKICFLSTKENTRIALDLTMDELEELSSTAGFFRINRQFIVHIRAIKKMVSLPKSRIKLSLDPETKLETVVSSERSAEFKKWLSGA